MSKNNVLKVALPLVLIAGIGIVGAKMYVNAQAEKQYNGYIEQFKAENPDIEITTGSVAYNPASSQFTASNVLLKSKTREDTLIIKELSFTKPHDQKGIPDQMDYSVKGLQINIDQISFNEPEEREMGIYLAGSDKIIEINAFGSEKVDKENNRIIFSSSMDIENLGNASINFNLDGLYNELNESLIAGEASKYKNNPFGLLGKLSLSGLSFSMESEKLSSFINYAGKQSEQTAESLLATFKKERSALKSREQEQELGEHFDNFLTAYEGNKELSVKISFNKVIDQGVVMGLMMSDKPGDTKLVQETLGLEVTTKVK